MLEIILKFLVYKKDILTVKKLWNIDISEFNHVIDQDGINHVKNRHGIYSKEKNEKIISDDDLKKIPEIIKNHDDILAGGISGSRKLPTMVYIKHYEEYKYYYVTEILKNKKELRIKTFYKDKKYLKRQDK
jgi:hypothetical protein